MKIDSPIEELTFQYLLKFIQSEKKERILKQRLKQDADNMLIGEILAKIVIKKNFGIDISKQRFVYTKHGKPYLMNYPNVHFNISHSGEYVVCAVSDKSVGIDIQKIGKYNSAVAKQVCNEKELEQIESSLDKASIFTKLWTQKEAVLKMQGLGISSSDIKDCLEHQDAKSQKIATFWVSVCMMDN